MNSYNTGHENSLFIQKNQTERLKMRNNLNSIIKLIKEFIRLSSEGYVLIALAYYSNIKLK